MECAVEKSTLVEATRCVEFHGAHLKEGYGRIKVNRKVKSLHRVSYEHFKGPIPPGKIVMHSCDNPKCWNPKHLFLGTWRKNMEDMYEKGRAVPFGRPYNKEIMQ